MEKATSKYVGVPEVAEMLGVSKMTINREIHKGHLPAVRVGRRLQILRSALDQYQHDNAVGDPSSLDPSDPETRPNVTNDDQR